MGTLQSPEGLDESGVTPCCKSITPEDGTLFGPMGQSGLTGWINLNEPN